VFARRDSAYRLVSSIGLTRPPIRVGAESAAGWRNLIVHVSGGGAKAADVELRFDGRAYPQNPSTLPAAQAERMQAATVVIAEFRSFEQAHPLPRVAPGPPPEPATAAAPAGPSFDCGQARSAAEKLVCSDPELARLDRDLATIYAAGMAQWPVEHHAVARTWQRRWIAEREACAEGAEPRACVEQSYRRRLVELRIQTGAYEVPAAVGYLCKQREQTPFTAVFYQQAEPRAAVLTYGDRQEVVFAVPSASGARYANARVEFWEHQGEAAVRWEGESLSCAVIPRQR
jgi:uncharacterized protein